MYSLVPQAMAMGASSVLLPLFVALELKGSLFDVGLVAAVSGVSMIPSLIFWGSIADSLSRYKIFMLLSFIGMGAAFLLISSVSSVYNVLVLVAFRSVSYAASVPTRQILTVESEGRQGWGAGISRLQFATGLGEATGMALGAVAVPVIGFRPLLTLCGLLCFASVVASKVLVQDPSLVIERRLMGVERFVNTLVRASNLVSFSDVYLRTGALNRISWNFSPSIKLFMVGILGFSLAGSMLFTALPVYFMGLYTTSTVFLLFYANSLANTLGYVLVAAKVGGSGRALIVSSALRMVLIPLFVLQAASGAPMGLTMAVVILVVLGVIWALFDVSSACLFMENSHVGRAGFYSAVMGLGSAAGGLLGGYVSMYYGFTALFAACSLIYAATLAVFAVQSRRMVI